MGRNQQEQKQEQGLEQETEYFNFINSLHSKATIQVYGQAINHFMRFINIDKASSLINQDTKTIEQQIISYLVDQRINQKLSYSILSVRLAALRKFYEMNDLVLNWKKVSNY
ncbi:MAG TPA: site-specific integrase [Nitrososphaeraceae archaeon]|jgi:site-specific recombinase XerD